jgi:hypothetical protein
MEKILIILTGAVFRYGEQHNQSLGDALSFEDQKAASMSHMALARHIKEKYSVTSDFLVDTYTTAFDDTFKSWYPEGSLINFHRPFKTYPWLLNTAVSRIADLDAYSGVLFVRGDLFLKPLFFDKFKMFEKITFSFGIARKFNSKNKNARPRVADLILYVPSKHFGVMAMKTISLTHESYDHYDAHSIEFMTDTTHDSDTGKCWNPLYRIANRKEAEMPAKLNTLGEFDGIWDNDYTIRKMPFPYLEATSGAHSPGWLLLLAALAMVVA